MVVTDLLWQTPLKTPPLVHSQHRHKHQHTKYLPITPAVETRRESVILPSEIEMCQPQNSVSQQRTSKAPLSSRILPAAGHVTVWLRLIGEAEVTSYTN